MKLFFKPWTTRKQMKKIPHIVVSIIHHWNYYANVFYFGGDVGVELV
jgi:hypothetical protein